MSIFNNNDVNLISSSDLPDDIRGKVKVGDKIRVSFPATESEATVTDIGQSYPNKNALILDKPLVMDVKPEITLNESSKSESPKAEDSVTEMPAPDKTKVVDTSVLTGPIDGLKNFLLKSQRDNDSK